MLELIFLNLEIRNISVWSSDHWREKSCVNTRVSVIMRYQTCFNIVILKLIKFNLLDLYYYYFQCIVFIFTSLLAQLNEQVLFKFPPRAWKIIIGLAARAIVFQDRPHPPPPPPPSYNFLYSNLTVSPPSVPSSLFHWETRTGKNSHQINDVKLISVPN